MKRSKVKALPDHSLDIFIDNAGIAVYGASVKHPVADGRDLVCVLDDAVIFVLEGFHDHLDGHCVIRHGILHHILVLISGLMGQLRTFNADPLTQSFRDNALVVHVDQLVF